MLKLIYSLAGSSLAIPVEHYLMTQRDRLVQEGRCLSSAERATLSPYFFHTDLDRIRIVIANPLTIPEPPLTGLVRRFGFNYRVSRPLRPSSLIM